MTTAVVLERRARGPNSSPPKVASRGESHWSRDTVVQVHPSRLRGGAGVVAALLLAACAESGPTGDVLDLVAAAEWELVEELRIGVGEGPHSFASIAAFAVTAAGDIFVADVASGPLAEIRMFDSTGAFVRTVARAGDGPGEVRRPVAMGRAADGGVWVVDPDGGRILYFQSDGDLGRQVTVPFAGRPVQWHGTIDDEGRILEPFTARPTPASMVEPGMQWLRRLSADGAVLDTIPYPSCVPEGPVANTLVTIVHPEGTFEQILHPVRWPQQVLLLGDGTAWCAPRRGDYEVIRVSLEVGDTIAQIRRPVVGPPVPDSVRERWEPVRARAARGGGTPLAESALPDHFAAIGLVGVDDADRLWVRPNPGPHTASDADGTTFDVFDDRGSYVAVARSSLRIRSVPLVIGEHAYAVVTGDLGVHHLVRARVAERPGSDR